MVKIGRGNKIGGWAFLIGVVLAVLFGALAAFNGTTLNSTVLLALIVIGLVIGLLNITDAEAMPFLLSGAVLVIISNFGNDVLGTISYVKMIFNALLAIFVPATVVAAIRNAFKLARS